jgi:acyl-CoA reductase-like NAD-dependent aldehyde dehydrogenase
MTFSPFPPPPPPVPATSLTEIDAIVARVARQKDAWIRTGIAARRVLLEQIIDGVVHEARGWAEVMSQLKGVGLGEPLHGEDWMYGPAATVRCARLLLDALREDGHPPPRRLYQRPDGQWVAQIFPASLIERLQGSGWSVEVWIQPGKPPSQGRIYRESPGTGKLALVLGAGNVSSIPATDVLYKLFVENEVVVLKMNPVNESAGPYLERAFQCLVDAGFFAVVYGGADAGKHLTDHAMVDSIHITGSDKTHDAIIWGRTPEEQAANKRSLTPRIQKPITSELGCVSPVIVVPGDWSAEDIRFHATSVAGMVSANASFNCLAAKCLVMHKGWTLREPFLAALEEAFRRTPPRKAYYPGAEERYGQFLAHTANPHVVGEPRPGCVPWTVFRDVPPHRGEYALSNEAFCGIIAETALDAENPADFLTRAVRFCNEDLWGSLSCSVIIDDATRTRHAGAFDKAIQDLRYGGIAVNGSAMFLFGLMSPTWGAYPGNTVDNVGSGIGVVHNAFLFDHPQKSVHYYPFRSWPKPPWFPNHRTLDELCRQVTFLEARPSLLRLVPVALAAIRG